MAGACTDWSHCIYSQEQSKMNAAAQVSPLLLFCSVLAPSVGWFHSYSGQIFSSWWSFSGTSFTDLLRGDLKPSQGANEESLPQDPRITPPQLCLEKHLNRAQGTDCT